MKRVEAQTGSPTSQPKDGVLKSLTKGVLAAFAAIGIQATVTENAHGAITITGMPNSTVSDPTFQPNSIGMLSNQFPSYQSSLVLNNKLLSIGTLAEGTIRYTLNFSVADVGTGGTLTISWDGQTFTGNSIGNPNGSGSAHGSNPYYVQQLTNWSKDGGIPTVSTLATLNEHDAFGVLQPRSNDPFATLSTPEEIHLAQHFSVNVPITSAGTYNLDYVLQAMNTNGAATQNNLVMSFAPIPETSTTLLAATGLAALAFRRKRDGAVEGPKTTTLNS